jgi:hypothetical protein
MIKPGPSNQKPKIFCFIVSYIFYNETLVRDQPPIVHESPCRAVGPSPTRTYRSAIQLKTGTGSRAGRLAIGRGTAQTSLPPGSGLD